MKTGEAEGERGKRGEEKCESNLFT